MSRAEKAQQRANRLYARTAEEHYPRVPIGNAILQAVLMVLIELSHLSDVAADDHTGAHTGGDAEEQDQEWPNQEGPGSDPHR